MFIKKYWFVIHLQLKDANESKFEINDESQRDGKCLVKPRPNQQSKIVIFKIDHLDLKHGIEHRYNRISVQEFLSKDAPSGDWFVVEEVYLWYWPKTSCPPKIKNSYINKYRYVNETYHTSNNTQISLCRKVRNYYDDIFLIIELRGKNDFLWNRDISILDNGTVSFGCIVIFFYNFPISYFPWKWCPHNKIQELMYYPETTIFME